jgi:hypothetical protein
VDRGLDLKRRLALLEVGLHLALEPGVRVDDVPATGLRAQLAAECLVRVDLLFGLGLVDLVGRLGDLAEQLGVEDGRVGLAVHIGAVVVGDLAGQPGLDGGGLLGDRVVQDLGGGLSLGRLVEVQCVVHDGVCLRVVKVDVFKVGEVLVVGVAFDVQCGPLGRLGRGDLAGEPVAFLGLVVFRRLLGAWRPIGVVKITL